MEKTTEFFDAWMASQKKTMDMWVDTTKRFQQNVLSLSGGRGESSGNPAQEMFNAYSSWLNSVLGAFAQKDNIDTVKDTASKLFGSSNVYMKMYEMWKPLLQAIQDKTLDVDSYTALLDPSRYKEVMDKIFGFSPDGVTELYTQAAKMFDTWGSMRGYSAPWSAAMEKGMKALPQFIEGRPDAIIGVFHDFFTAFDATFGKVFHVPAVGKDREKIELLLRLSDCISVYLSKNTKYQYLMYATGLSAMDKVVEGVAAKVKEGKDITGFEEFFDTWVDVTEKRYLELFQTDEFSKLQGEFLDAAMDVRRNYFKLLELYLYDAPVVLRSEMDDTYKTIYDLKKRVRSLERQLKDLSKKEVTV